MAQLTGTITVQCVDLTEYNNWSEQLAIAVTYTADTGVISYVEHLNDLYFEIVLDKAFNLPPVVNPVS